MLPKKKPQTTTQRILNKTKRVTKRADGTVRIVRDTYHGPKKSWWDWCKQILERDDYRCRAMYVRVDGTKFRCTNSKAGGYRLEVHHVKPLSRGGRTVAMNLMSLCEECHQRRHRHKLNQH